MLTIICSGVATPGLTRAECSALATEVQALESGHLHYNKLMNLAIIVL